VALLFGPAQALADFQGSKSWFEPLPFELRTKIQVSLIWIAGYDGLPDGEFGQRTFESMSKFEALLGHVPDGILSTDQLQQLFDGAQTEQQKVGFNAIQQGGISFSAPTALVTERMPTNTGIKMSSKDGDLEVQTYIIPSSIESFDSLYTRLSKSESSRSVTYSLIDRTYFAVGGYVEAKAFYLFAHRTSSGTVGISTAWPPQKTEMQVLAIAIAASLVPSEKMISSDQNRKLGGESKKQPTSKLKAAPYTDFSGLERPSTEFDADSAACSMFARREYQRVYDPCNVKSNNGISTIICATGAYAAKRKAFRECMQSRYWKIP
jgi:hypothetical protein